MSEKKEPMMSEAQYEALRIAYRNLLMEDYLQEQGEAKTSSLVSKLHGAAYAKNVGAAAQTLRDAYEKTNDGGHFDGAFMSDGKANGSLEGVIDVLHKILSNNDFEAGAPYFRPEKTY